MKPAKPKSIPSPLPTPTRRARARLTAITVPILLIVVVALLHSAGTAAATGESFERCTDYTQCSDGYACYVYEAKPINGNGPAFVFCNGDSDKECICLRLALPAVQTCVRTADCPHPREVCAVDKNQKSFCVSCNGMDGSLEAAYSFRLYDPNDPKCASAPPAPTPTASPTPLPTPEAFDLCVDAGPVCKNGLCVKASSTSVSCSSTDPICLCDVNEPSNCTTSAECVERTVCATAVATRARFCVSCTHVALDVYFIPVDASASACKVFPPPPATPVKPGRNGFTFDKCRFDAQCIQPRRCLSFRGEILNWEPCLPDDDLCYCITEERTFPRCEASQDCLPGETCTTFPSLANTTCMSTALADNMGPRWSRQLGDPVQPTPSGDQPLLSGQRCAYDWDCKGIRRCRHGSEPRTYGDCAGREPCICAPPLVQPCDGDDDCDEGEACARIIGSNVLPFCMEATVIMDEWLLEAFDADDSVLSSPLAQPSPLAQSLLTGEGCQQADECAEPRICRHITERLDLPCAGRRGCFCELEAPVLCNKTAECPQGELCTVIKDDERSEARATCRSATANSIFGASVLFFLEVTPFVTPPALKEESDEPDLPQVSKDGDDAVCIDARAMLHLPASQRVFAASRPARVLCDTFDSCATPGHMVVWQSRPMMMQSYCALVRNCVPKVMAVNSPKMKRKLRVPSRTQGLDFTVFASRYASALEETLLTSLVRLGL